jgi:hypothetical protein
LSQFFLKNILIEFIASVGFGIQNQYYLAESGAKIKEVHPNEW